MRLVLRYANGDVEHRDVTERPPSTGWIVVDGAGFRHVRTTLGMLVFEQETCDPRGVCASK
jgi:hypothetical protein